MIEPWRDELDVDSAQDPTVFLCGKGLADDNDMAQLVEDLVLFQIIVRGGHLFFDKGHFGSYCFGLEQRDRKCWNTGMLVVTKKLT